MAATLEVKHGVAIYTFDGINQNGTAVIVDGPISVAWDGTGTVSWDLQTSEDGSTWLAARGGNGSAQIANKTATGDVLYLDPGLKYFRAKSDATSTGSVTIWLRANKLVSTA